MYTSLFVLALVGAPLEANAPSWQGYYQASQLVEQEKKPLAVFLGTGQKGWEKVAGSLSPEAEKVLTAGYLCAYVDTTTPEGEKLAQAFEIKNGVGIVISDRKGVKQAFWHQGTLGQPDLAMPKTERRVMGSGPAPAAVRGAPDHEPSVLTAQRVEAAAEWHERRDRPAGVGARCRPEAILLGPRPAIPRRTRAARGWRARRFALRGSIPVPSHRASS